MLSTWELSSVHIGFLRLLCMHFHAYMGNISKQTIGLFFLSSILNLLWNRNIFWFVALLCLFAFICLDSFSRSFAFWKLEIRRTVQLNHLAFSADHNFSGCLSVFGWIWISSSLSAYTMNLPDLHFRFTCPSSPTNSFSSDCFLLLYINRGTMYRG